MEQHWALEFLLRSPLADNNLIKKVFRRIPVLDADSRLMKTLLLRALRDHLSTVSIAEPILQILEHLEELHRRDASPVTASMSAAYCAVAVECTLKYLRVGLYLSYLSVVNRIWRVRVPHMNGSGSGSGSGEESLLFSMELKRWESDIEASLSDSQVRERLASIDSRRDAIHKLKAYLAEAWPDLGPSFLQVAASLQPQERVIQKCSTVAAEAGHPSTTIEFQKVVERGSLDMQMLTKDCLEAHVEKQSANADVPCPNDVNNNEADPMEKDQTSVPQGGDHKPSLMEKNSTARTFEWDDLIDGFQRGISNDEGRFHLPSPERRKLSPLMKYKSTGITKRRKVKKWSQLEEETLKTAVDKFGCGNWKLILNSHKDIFAERTEVDLKDKWRNMIRYGCN